MVEYSVLMSVYFKEKSEYFCAAIKSMLEQTIKPSDFVLICDGPLTKELDAVIDEYTELYPGLFQVIRNEYNQGLGLALRQGIDYCKYELIARMDTDDIALPDRMEKQLAVFREYPGLSVVGGQIAEFEGSVDNIISYRTVPLESENIKKRAAVKNPMNHMTVTMKKSHVLEDGNYQDLKFFEDYQLWAKMLGKGRSFRNIEKVCVYARVNDALYKRRAGISYFRQTVRMQRYLYEYGIATRIQIFMNCVIRFWGTVVLPNHMRAYVYKALLRKKRMD